MAADPKNKVSIALATDEKIAETSSKGNQEKWFDRQQNRWYKLDQFGYESLSETVVSRILEKSNLERDFPFRFVRYQMERVRVHGRERNSCSSENFLLPGQSIITLSHLHSNAFGERLGVILGRLDSTQKRIAWLGEKTAELTGLELFPQYLTMMFEVDGLFLNEDRHLNNIAVLEQNGQFDYCPLFDHGASLLSNTMIYAMDIEPKAHIRTVKARPFQTTFNRQIAAAQRQYGKQLKMPIMTEREIQRELSDILPFYAQRDRDYIAERVCACILTRQKKA